VVAWFGVLKINPPLADVVGFLISTRKVGADDGSGAGGGEGEASMMTRHVLIWPCLLFFFSFAVVLGGRRGMGTVDGVHDGSGSFFDGGGGQKEKKMDGAVFGRLIFRGAGVLISKWETAWGRLPPNRGEMIVRSPGQRRGMGGGPSDIVRRPFRRTRRADFVSCISDGDRARPV